MWYQLWNGETCKQTLEYHDQHSAYLMYGCRPGYDCDPD
jgi:hypothetical protein